MDMRRAFLAIIISFIILLGYQYLFLPPVPPQQPAERTTVQPEQAAPAAALQQTPAQPAAELSSTSHEEPASPTRPARELIVDTDRFTAVISERGGALTSFILKEHREENKPEAPGVQMIKDTPQGSLPLGFSWGSAVAEDTLYTFDSETVSFDPTTGRATVTMRATTPAGLEIVRSFVFARSDYVIEHSATVINRSGQVLQGMAGLHQRSQQFVTANKFSEWLFRGPAYYDQNGLHEIKLKEFQEGGKTIPTNIDWVAYEDNYFMRGIIPVAKPISAISLNAVGELVTIDVHSPLDTLADGTEKTYSYRLFYGPKIISELKETGANLAKIVNFGWFDVIAKPMLYLLNWFYGVFSNYGLAIILVTVLLKALFWPITQKGLKSMKNMQKLQPKMVKLKEKYKGDPTKMNQEMMNLYKTYKVNPLGGCLPMVLQIPVFFALYKVLLQSIELRHAPFMLWITDLSAPDRLYIGFDLPYLGGLPVLTLLMGASMFIQQKMTPTTADPTQAKIMLFLPVIFTVMFVNFASGLVLYWFVNNLLSILQQYLINRQRKPIPTTES